MRVSTLILLVLVIALGLYIRFFERHRDPTERKREIARRVLRINPSRITAIRVTQPELQYTLEKREEEWRLVSPVDARADAGVITRLLDTIEWLERGDVIRGREWRNKGMTLADFGLEDPRARIHLKSPDKEWTLLLGRDTPVAGNMFIKELNDASIFVVPTNLLADLPASIDALRDRRIFLGFPGDVTRIDLRRREGVLSLARSDIGSWRMQQPWNSRAASTAVRDLLDQLFTSRIVDFIAETIDAAPLYGLDEPLAQASVTGDRRYGEQTLLIGKPTLTDSNFLYATRSGENRVFTVPRSLLDALQTRAEILRDRRVLTMTAYEIAAIRIEEGERSILLAKDESGAWEIREPIRARADANRIQNAIAEWAGLRIESFIDNFSTNLAAWGLEPPARRLVFSRRMPADAASSKTAADDDQIVLVSTSAPSNGLVTALLAHENTLVRIQESALASLPFDVFAFRSLEILNMDVASVRSLTRQENRVEETIVRDSPTNDFRAAVPGTLLDPEQVKSTLETLSSLRAVRFVAASDDLASYGLEPPHAQLTIGVAGELAPVRTLVIGREAPDGVYAALRGGDAIFVLSRETTDKLLRPLYQPPRPTADRRPASAQPERPAEPLIPPNG